MDTIDCDNIKKVASSISLLYTYWVKLNELVELNKLNELDYLNTWKLVNDILYKGELKGLYAPNAEIEIFVKSIIDSEDIKTLGQFIIVSRDKINQFYRDSKCKGSILWNEQLQQATLSEDLYRDLELYKNKPLGILRIEQIIGNKKKYYFYY